MATVADELQIQSLPQDVLDTLRRLAAEGTLYEVLDVDDTTPFGDCVVCGRDTNCGDF